MLALPMSIYIVPTLVCLTVALVAFFLGRRSDRPRPKRDRRFESWSDPQKQVWHALQHALCDLDAVWTRKDSRPRTMPSWPAWRRN